MLLQGFFEQVIQFKLCATRLPYTWGDYFAGLEKPAGMLFSIGFFHILFGQNRFLMEHVNIVG
jgi:hypothetical protein